MKKAVVYGAGNIGRGFVGQLLAQSGYQVSFIEVNQAVVAQLNAEHAYPINIVSEEGNEEILIQDVQAIDGRDAEAVAQAISNADLMATAVGVPILPRIAPLVAQGLTQRAEQGNSKPLNMNICENLIDADQYLKKLVSEAIDPSLRPWLEEHVGFVEASVGRMVPVMTEKMKADNPLRIMVEPYCQLPVDREGFKGDIPAVKNLLPASPFAFYIQRKLYIHNLGHALLAYFGQMKGLNYIWQAVRDPVISRVVLAGMTASAHALSREHGQDLPAIMEHVQDLLYRFDNRQLGDTVERVGRDIPRKLAHDDRLVGAMNLCIKHRIDPSPIVLGIEAALACARRQEHTLMPVDLDEAVMEGLRALSGQILQA